MSLVSLKRVEKIYSLGETRITALRGIDLEIQPGEFAAVWGPSGCGKSTLCNLVGLIDHPTSGAVEFMGRDCNALSDDERSELRSRSIGFIFQSFNLIPVLSAIENVMLPLQIQGGTTAQSAREAMDNLVEMDLADHAEHRPHKLSGGQQQRVAIARALITRPSLVIADEPTANLDSENAGRILDLMLQVCEKRGTAFLFSTHDQRLLNRAHRLIHLRDGSILEDRSTAGGED